ncbi:MAG: tRNA (adenosine(37)-N6)-dimethylallyltransferase MiaA [Desulfobacterales bacterium]|nr:tRNA (adenosine(37)-N6)-dimethylallyltransferase MiaA [Desulfobacterales bacterium]
MNKPRIIIIVGPTAVGKSQLALELAARINAEIISADSMQVYRYMDIGTAKPTSDEQEKVKHHLIDILYPDEEFSAALFKQEAREVTSNVDRQGKVAIIAGGTGLYIKALTRGLFKGPGTDPELRRTLIKKAVLAGNDYLYKELSELDPVTAARLHPNDSFRIIRAIEVCRLTQKPLSEYHEKHSFKDSPFDTFKIGLYIDRKYLYSRIEKRVDRMIAIGLVDEVKCLLDMGYARDLNSMQGLGYKQVTGYLMGEFSLDDAILQVKQGTKRYAKRQMTWFRADPEINWYAYPYDYPRIIQKTKGFLEA